MKLRKKLKKLNYNEDQYFNNIGVFDTKNLNKYELINCILDIISYINFTCPIELKADYFITCADLSFEFVDRFPYYSKFNNVFLEKLEEMLHNPYMTDEHKSSIRFYIGEIKKII